MPIKYIIWAIAALIVIFGLYQLDGISQFQYTNNKTGNEKYAVYGTFLIAFIVFVLPFMAEIESKKLSNNKRK